MNQIRVYLSFRYHFLIFFKFISNIKSIKFWIRNSYNISSGSISSLHPFLHSSCNLIQGWLKLSFGYIRHWSILNRGIIALFTISLFFIFIFPFPYAWFCQSTDDLKVIECLVKFFGVLGWFLVGSHPFLTIVYGTT